MNAKKVKAIRHSMRNAGVDCRDAKYTVGAWSMWFYGHVTLDPKCGRAKYKVIKRVAA
jgi:hypothetical protein